MKLGALNWVIDGTSIVSKKKTSKRISFEDIDKEEKKKKGLSTVVRERSTRRSRKCVEKDRKCVGEHSITTTSSSSTATLASEDNSGQNISARSCERKEGSKRSAMSSISTNEIVSKRHRRESGSRARSSKVCKYDKSKDVSSNKRLKSREEKIN